MLKRFEMIATHRKCGVCHDNNTGFGCGGNYNYVPLYTMHAGTIMSNGEGV